MSNINFHEQMAKIGIDSYDKLIERSKEDTNLLLNSNLDHKSDYIEWEKNFRQWCREAKEKEKEKMLDNRR